MSIKKKYSKREAGVSLVELSIFIALLFVLIGAAVEFGLMLLSSYRMQNAAREGVRLAVSLSDLEASDPRVIQSINEQYLAKDSLIFVSDVNLSVDAPTLVSPMGDSMDLCRQEVTVGVNGVFNFHILGLIGFEELPMNQTTTMRYQWQDLCPA